MSTTKVATRTRKPSEPALTTDSSVLTLDDLDALVPVGVAAKYVGRKIHGVQDFTVLRDARTNHENVLIYGPTGPGKTMVARAYAETDQVAFYPFNCSAGGTLSGLVGKMTMQPDGKFVWQDGPLTALARRGGVFYLNEVNMLPPNIAASLFGLLDARRQLVLEDHDGEIVNVHPNFQIIADYNPDYRGTRPLNEAFKNRFPVKVEWDYDTVVEKSLVVSGSLRDMASKLRKMVGTEIQTPVSTNMLMEFEKFTSRYSVRWAGENFISAFDGDERPAVRNVVKMHLVGIEEDLNPKPAPVVDDVEDLTDIDLDDIAFEIEV